MKELQADSFNFFEISAREIINEGFRRWCEKKISWDEKKGIGCQLNKSSLVNDGTPQVVCHAKT